MRILQIGIFLFAVLSFLVSAVFIGQEMGDTLWRVGIASILVDLACAKLWPSAKKGAAAI
jgi:hypothetical protein